MENILVFILGFFKYIARYKLKIKDFVGVLNAVYITSSFVLFEVFLSALIG
jgi:hypothetical protein